MTFFMSLASFQHGKTQSWAVDKSHHCRSNWRQGIRSRSNTYLKSSRLEEELQSFWYNGRATMRVRMSGSRSMTCLMQWKQSRSSEKTRGLRGSIIMAEKASEKLAA